MKIFRTKYFGILSDRVRAAIKEKLGYENIITPKVTLSRSSPLSCKSTEKVLELARKTNPNSKFLRDYDKIHGNQQGFNKHVTHNSFHLHLNYPEGWVNDKSTLVLHRYGNLSSVKSILEKGLLKGNCGTGPNAGRMKERFGSVSTWLGEGDSIANSLLNVSDKSNYLKGNPLFKNRPEYSRGLQQFYFLDGNSAINESQGKGNLIRWVIELPKEEFEEYSRKYNLADLDNPGKFLDEIRVFKNIPPKYLKIAFPFGCVRKDNVEQYQRLLEEIPIEKFDMNDEYTSKIVSLIKNRKRP